LGNSFQENTQDAELMLPGAPEYLAETVPHWAPEAEELLVMLKFQ